MPPCRSRPPLCDCIDRRQAVYSHVVRRASFERLRTDASHDRVPDDRRRIRPRSTRSYRRGRAIRTDSRVRDRVRPQRPGGRTPELGARRRAGRRAGVGRLGSLGRRFVDDLSGDPGVQRGRGDRRGGRRDPRVCRRSGSNRRRQCRRHCRPYVRRGRDHGRTRSQRRVRGGPPDGLRDGRSARCRPPRRPRRRRPTRPC